MTRQRLFCAEHNIEGRLLAGLLTQHGIDVEIRGEQLSGAIGELPADLIQVELWVEEANLVQAQQLVQQWQQQNQDGEQWQCQQCQEINPASFDLCWQCGAPAHYPAKGTNNDGI